MSGIVPKWSNIVKGFTLKFPKKIYILFQGVANPFRIGTVDKKTIGNRIKARREFLQFSQEKLAELCEVSRITISNWERGEREMHITDLPTVASALKVPLNYFYGDDDIEGPIINDYYNGLSVGKRAVADEVIRSLWLQDQREETTHGRKAE